MGISKSSIVIFSGGYQGQWIVKEIRTVIGQTIENVPKLEVSQNAPADCKWMLKGAISNLRYTKRSEKTELDSKSMSLERPEFNLGALIPIKKSEEWWMLTQDERRKIFEEDSKHISISAGYLSMISRQLHHSRDLGEPFDFLTWFEFASKDEGKFDELAETLRKTEEWKYVIREVDIRLIKNSI